FVPMQVVQAGDDGAVDVDGIKKLVPDPGAIDDLSIVRFAVVRGPGSFDARGHYLAHFDGPGRSAVVYRVSPAADDGLGAFIVERLVVAASIGALSVPPFWLGLMGVVIFAARWQVLPAGGIATPGMTGLDAVADFLWHAALPVSVLAVGYCGPFLRYVRTGVV